ncbi:unnamed protein product [Protopolystoma xenopodis]|uniref:HTH La-type RNA-binding domain-containing protein n=1 Tax=Protopolystoma xenopodis TaxID=117903 RepID=A0A3S5FCC3_9PLAT|nr:unnamed protein product [Protopolystoma xenopodis]
MLYPPNARTSTALPLPTPLIENPSSLNASPGGALANSIPCTLSSAFPTGASEVTASSEHSACSFDLIHPHKSNVTSAADTPTSDVASATVATAPLTGLLGPWLPLPHPTFSTGLYPLHPLAVNSLLGHSCCVLPRQASDGANSATLAAAPSVSPFPATVPLCTFRHLVAGPSVPPLLIPQVTSLSGPRSHALQLPYHMRAGFLRRQIDFYFSETNLVHDLFLRRQMDPEGWVSLATIASFKRIASDRAKVC